MAQLQRVAQVAPAGLCEVPLVRDHFLAIRATSRITALPRQDLMSGTVEIDTAEAGIPCPPATFGDCTSFEPFPKPSLVVPGKRQAAHGLPIPPSTAAVEPHDQQASWKCSVAPSTRSCCRRRAATCGTCPTRLPRRRPRSRHPARRGHVPHRRPNPRCFRGIHEQSYEGPRCYGRTRHAAPAHCGRSAQCHFLSGPPLQRCGPNMAITEPLHAVFNN